MSYYVSNTLHVILILSVHFCLTGLGRGTEGHTVTDGVIQDGRGV